MDDVLIPIAVCGMLFIGMPWLILHYVSKWKTNTPVMTGEDERLLDDMYTTARRLEERLETVERIIAADNPDFRAPRITAASDDYRVQQLERRN
jgi:phage shock protein B